VDDADIDRAVRALVEARKTRSPADVPPGTVSLTVGQAYAVQDRHVAALADSFDARQVGYKIGCTNPTAQALLGLEGPFRGKLLDRFCHASPAELPANDFFFRCIEAEYGVRLAADLPADAAPFDGQEVWDRVGDVFPAIEIVDSRYTDWRTAGAANIIADNGSTGHWVHGPSVPDWRDHDLLTIDVTVSFNGEPVRTGNAANVMGHPMHVLSWLANHLAETGSGLKAGDLVTTGTCIDVFFAEAGDQVEADYGPLGTVAVGFT
jgi:2-keto-4-pentenoate hydratase